MASTRNRLKRIIVADGERASIAKLLVSCFVSLALLSYVSYAASNRTSRVGRSSSSLYHNQSMEPPLPVRRFVEFAREHKIDKVELRYVRWDLEYSNRLSEHDLMTFPPDCAVDAGRYVADQVSVRLTEAFSHARLEKKEIARSELDFGLAATFYGGENELLRICVSKYPPAVSINGEIFAAPSRVVHALTALLPAVAREGMFLYTIDEWATPPYKETIGGMRRMGPGLDEGELDAMFDAIREKNKD